MSEFDLINQFFKTAIVQRDDVLLGIGDDCAILSPPPGKVLAVSTDTLICGVHFPESTSPEDIGYKSLAVNLSDLAAMGAKPAWVSLAITLPTDDVNWLEKFMQGFNELAQKYNVALIGGDTTQGPLSISINITGFIDKEKVIKRSAANIGDSIFVTGTIGDACIGLKVVLDKLPGNTHLACCESRLNRPTARVEAGLILSEFPVSAIDISDGLMADLSHICKASGVGALLNLEKIPLSSSLMDYFNREPEPKSEPDWQMILTAGDDYELCFTCPENKVEQMQIAMSNAGVDIACIGKITDSSTIDCELNGQSIRFNKTGYNHF